MLRFGTWLDYSCQMSKLVWVELDSRAPDYNIRQIRNGAAPGTLFCAVVKSNAYGHGVREIVPLLQSADWFAVNSLEEALELKEIGVSKPVLILGHVPLNNLAYAVESGFRLTVYNKETIEALSRISEKNRRIKVHIKIETGTGRQGVLPENVKEFTEKIITSDSIEIEGLSTHFSNIEDTLNHSYAKKQLETLRKSLDEIKSIGVNPPVIHTACTAASILFPETHFNMLRSGIGVYGLWPSRETFLSVTSGERPVPELKPVLTWKTRVIQIKTFPTGSFIGYGCSYRTTRETRIAVLPVGYADGYDRSLGNMAYVLIYGKRAAVLGRVCMNLIMVDITDIENVRLEDEVVLLGRSGEEVITAELMADWASTINYEIVTRISPLLSRHLVDNN